MEIIQNQIDQGSTAIPLNDLCSMFECLKITFIKTVIDGLILLVEFVFNGVIYRIDQHGSFLK